MATADPASLTSAISTLIGRRRPSLRPATHWRSSRPQFHSRYACRDVHTRLRLNGYRLQGDRAIRPAHKKVGTNSGANSAAGGRACIGSSQRGVANRGRGINGPNELTAGRGPYIETKRADGAFISLARPASRRCIDAAQLPLSSNNHADPGRYVARECADSRSSGLLRRCRNRGEHEGQGRARCRQIGQPCFVQLCPNHEGLRRAYSDGPSIRAHPAMFLLLGKRIRVQNKSLICRSSAGRDVWPGSDAHATSCEDDYFRCRGVFKVDRIAKRFVAAANEMEAP